ncbi:MAG: ATP-binding protein, partial [Anaerolineae bacterium]|nr:ATP-binding protein [Anaerolineae bacterium]
ETLDLVYDDAHKYYEAPFQMKANGGMLLIDDFGRQLVRPRDLLNRWIVPLEKRVDYLTLHTGRKIEVPFDVLIVFATNLAPH